MTLRRFHRCPVCNSATTSSQWNDVAGGLPDDDAVVLIALSNGEVWTAWYQSGDTDTGIAAGWRDLDGDSFNPATVLYWLPLPPHPDAKEEPEEDHRAHWEEQTLKDLP